MTDLAALSDLSAPWAVRVAPTLRLADHVASGTDEVTALARAVGADADALLRLLRFLACRGVFAEREPGRFALTPAAELLREDHPARLRRWLDQDGAGGRMDLAWPALLQAVRGGGAGYPAVFGAPFWADLDRHPALAGSFAALLGGAAEELARELAHAYDWSGARHVVDVAGGTGALLAVLLASHPRLRGTLVELPHTARAAAALLRERGLEGRADVVAGSAFESLPAGADVYLLSWVLHDWPDADAARILRRCAEAAGARGRVVVVESAAPAAPSPLVTALDLRMLLLVGGRERTAEEYAALAAEAGLALREVARTSLGRVVLEGRADARASRLRAAAAS